MQSDENALHPVPDCLSSFQIMLLNHERINKRIRCSAIGTVVHVYNHHFYEVEFAGLKGQTYALLTLPAEQLLLLKHEPQTV